MMTNNKQAFSAGARYERAALLRKVRSLRGLIQLNPKYLENWIKERQKRYSKRKGGL